MMEFGGVAEWPKAADLKSVVAQVTVGSNPTASAIHCYYRQHVRRGDRVADGARLLSECSESYRGFESLPLRHLFWGVVQLAERWFLMPEVVGSSPTTPTK